MTPRLRSNLAWALRSVARWLDRKAEAIEPIKLNREISNCVLVAPVKHTAMSSRIEHAHYVASKDVAKEIIRRASTLKPVR